MHRSILRKTSYALLLALLTGCASAGPVGKRVATPAPNDPKPQVLDRSLFSHAPNGAITEDDLQTVLSTPIDLAFPARVGVVPLAEAFDPAQDASITVRSVASRDFARALRKHEHFSHVSDVSTDLPNVGGIEGLRAIAARYRLRYLLLYSERFEDDTHLNGWAWLYPTILGMFVAPGVTVQSAGLAQVDLLDVRTGTVLLSAVEPMTVSSAELMIGAAREHREEQAAAAADAANRLARSVQGQVQAMLHHAQQPAVARARPILPAPVQPMPPLRPEPTPVASGATPDDTETSR